MSRGFSSDMEDLRSRGSRASSRAGRVLRYDSDGYVVEYDDDEYDDGRPSTADIIASQSQDYVDEKLAEYQATIQQLQGRAVQGF
ncbi:hypothetical protein J437_LFUL001569 [Ladona fulva]|uniref:Uncharacterized protein n=1 Tax=Ladona fulva TaxID=123851 RepID=A0A8K0KPV8_LADFU|nr:hypothetical protein J437_LFUL001569 [Ladona fulva]